MRLSEAWLHLILEHAQYEFSRPLADSSSSSRLIQEDRRRLCSQSTRDTEPKGSLICNGVGRTFRSLTTVRGLGLVGHVADVSFTVDAE